MGKGRSRFAEPVSGIVVGVPESPERSRGPRKLSERIVGEGSIEPEGRGDGDSGEPSSRVVGVIPLHRASGVGAEQLSIEVFQVRDFSAIAETHLADAAEGPVGEVIENGPRGDGKGGPNRLDPAGAGIVGVIHRAPARVHQGGESSGRAQNPRQRIRDAGDGARLPRNISDILRLNGNVVASWKIGAAADKCNRGN